MVFFSSIRHAADASSMAGTTNVAGNSGAVGVSLGSAVEFGELLGELLGFDVELGVKVGDDVELALSTVTEPLVSVADIV